jgi:hypothetical protein
MFSNITLTNRLRSAHSSVSLHLRFYATGPLYEIEGVLYSKEEIQAIAPEQRTVAQWLLLVDWDLARMRPYVIIDPFDPSGLLYLNSAEYLVQARTLASNNVPFVVVSRPGTVKPVPAKNPPEFLAPVLDAIETPEYGISSVKPEKGGKEHEVSGSTESLASDFSRRSWKEFSDLRKWISKNCPWGEGETVDLHHGNVMGLLVMWARELLHYLEFKSPGSRIGQLTPLIQHLQTLLLHNGPAYTIARLKISLFCLYSYVGGNPVKDTSGLGQRVRLRGGLPIFLGIGPRSSIRQGNLGSIRLWASLLNIYKVMKGPHGPSPLETIEAPKFEGDMGDFASFCQGWDTLFDRWQATIKSDLPEWKYKTAWGYVITSAGANSSCAMSSLYRDAAAWKGRTDLPQLWFDLWKDRQMHGIYNLTKIEGETWARAHSRLDGHPSVIPWQDEGTPKQRLDAIWKCIRRVLVMDEDGEMDLIWRPSTRNLNDLRALQVATVQARLDKAIAKLNEYHKKKGLPTSLPISEKTTYVEFKEWLAKKEVPKSLELQAVERQLISRDSQREIPNGLLEEWIELFRTVGLHPTKFSHDYPITGRLHSIPEPAGKVRVVAIGDYFSQVALKPLHEYIFKLLRLNPNDATFDQQGAVDQFAAKGYKDIYSYDLKSATDLIPAQLYKEVLEPLIGRKGADLWLALMKDREWLAPKDLRKAAKNPNLMVRYTRGQPMGLLSSWAALALVHHALVQFAAKRAGWTEWFPHYLVLGDDITIADQAVAEAYLNVCDEFGIKVGLAKSLISHTGLMNFASQTLLGDKNISPISLGEELSALSLDRRKELAKRIVHRYDGEDTKVNSYLKRILTVNQWSALQAELTGARPRYLSRFIEFVLQNPFLSEEFDIDRVINWLGLLVPRLTSDDSLRTELGCALRAALLSFVERELAVKRESLKVILGGLSRLQGGGPNNDWELPHLWHYIADALLARFNKIGREFDAISLQVKRMHPEIVPELSSVVELWRKLQDLLPIPADKLGEEPRWGVFSMLKSYDLEVASRQPTRTGKLGTIQGRFPAPKAPRESLRVPSQPLMEVVGKVLGIKFPVFELVHRRPSNSFFATIMASIREMKANRLNMDASAVLNTRALVVPQVVMPMVPLFRVDPLEKVDG